MPKLISAYYTGRPDPSSPAERCIRMLWAARLPFLDWLSGLALNLSAKDNNAILGNTMTLHVPCGTLDL